MSTPPKIPEWLVTGPLNVDYSVSGEFHSAEVTLKEFDGVSAIGVSRRQEVALGYALRDIADQLINRHRQSSRS